MYESEITQFLKQLKAEKPHLEAEQQKGRALLWDKPQNLEENERRAQANVAQQPYVYQTKR
jgi:Protein of unknown function (DUF3460)